MKYAVGKMNNNDVAYIDPDHRWTTSGGILNTNLYYKDNLHLVEKGNEKLEKAITTAFNVGALKQQQNLPEIGQQHQKKLPQHQQKHHYQQQEGQQHREEFQKRTAKAKTKAPTTSNRTSIASRRDPETPRRTTVISATTQTT